MKPVVLENEAKKKRAKNNLDDFDADLIRAELSALEGSDSRPDSRFDSKSGSGLKASSAETMGDFAKLKAAKAEVERGDWERERQAAGASSIEFSPDSSKLLHKAVRASGTTQSIPKKEKGRPGSVANFKGVAAEGNSEKVAEVKFRAPKKEVAKQYPGEGSGSKPNLRNGANPKLKLAKAELEVKRLNKAEKLAEGTAVLSSGSARSMDSFVRPNGSSSSSLGEQKLASRMIGNEGGGTAPSTLAYREGELSLVGSADSAEVAMSGMNRANQFNGFLQSSQKTNIQNQLEKQNLFPNEIKPGSVVYDHGLQSRAVNRYNPLKSSHKMLGGVDQHNLGPGILRRFVGMRSVKFLSPVLAFVLVGGYLFYLNMPKLNLRLAESKSGIAISTPSYTPEKFSLNRSIETETGKVTMNFVNGEKSYSVSQSVSDWDSSALLENKVLKESKDYSAYTDRGLTIYVYDGKAVWMNQGKVNEISLNGVDLDTEEMIRIAGSM
jgi:hypothetical protein